MNVANFWDIAPYHVSLVPLGSRISQAKNQRAAGFHSTVGGSGRHISINFFSIHFYKWVLWTRFVG
jgi:hypothetical protein